MPKTDQEKIAFVSLGCPKALVDSERIITRLRADGYVLSNDPKEASAVIVNTCGFIDSAKAESLEAIGNAMAENGKVIVTGCMGAEPELIRQEYPDILAITGPQQYEQIINHVHAVAPPNTDPHISLLPGEGLRLTPRHYAYLKISEGCNNSCRFCIIPKLRGRLVSRKIDDVYREAERLAKAGVKELLVISQDTSAYGLDIGYETKIINGQSYDTRLYDLANILGNFGIWIRLHYLYPYPHVDDIIPLMSEGRILPYLDIPFQHAAPNVLKMMRRPAHQEKTLSRIKNWREQCPDLAIRSTFIVGYPGETEEDFQYLLDWMSEAKIDRAGCFQYENVEGAEANSLPNPVDEDEKEDRWHRFMAHAQELSASQLYQKIGKQVDVIIDEIDGNTLIGRSPWDAPDIDGTVIIENTGNDIAVGDVISTTITHSDEYDLFAIIKPVT